MKKFIVTLAALFALPTIIAAQSPQYTAQAGVTFFVAQPATATAVSGAVRLPTFSGSGVLTVVETGVTGSPSGCTVKLAYQSNGGGAATAAVSTTSFTPSTGVQTFVIAPTVPAGDNYIATYACSSTYPTAGALTASFSPLPSNTIANTAGSGDPCQNPSVAKASASVAIASASTVQIVALSSGKKTYVCDANLTAVGTSPSILFLSGTGTACGTADQTFTGTMIPSATVGSLHLGYGGTLMTTNASDELCITAGGTASVQGVVTYVQQ